MECSISQDGIGDILFLIGVAYKPDIIAQVLYELIMSPTPSLPKSCIKLIEISFKNQAPLLLVYTYKVGVTDDI